MAKLDKFVARLGECPFCHSPDIVMEAPTMSGKTRAVCRGCGCGSGWDTPEEVVARWNRRDGIPGVAERTQPQDENT